MDKKKLIPIIAIIVLLIGIIVILCINQNNQKKFKLLRVVYKGEEVERDNLNINDVIVINNISFWVVSKSKSGLVIKTSNNVYYSEEQIDEIEILKDKDYEICFDDKSCALLNVS